MEELKNNNFGLNSGYAGEIRHGDKLLEATRLWCDTVSSWATLCDVTAFEKEVQGWLELRSSKCTEYAMNQPSVQRELGAEEECEFHGFLVCYVSLLFVLRGPAPLVNGCGGSITQRTTSDRLEELTRAQNAMWQQLKVVAELVARLVNLVTNNTCASAGAGKRASRVLQLLHNLQLSLRALALRQELRAMTLGSTQRPPLAFLQALQTQSALA